MGKFSLKGARRNDGYRVACSFGPTTVLIRENDDYDLINKRNLPIIAMPTREITELRSLQNFEPCTPLWSIQQINARFRELAFDHLDTPSNQTYPIYFASNGTQLHEAIAGTAVRRHPFVGLPLNTPNDSVLLLKLTSFLRINHIESFQSQLLGVRDDMQSHIFPFDFHFKFKSFRDKC